MPKVRLHAFVSGRVQGVNFRWNTKIAAKRLGLTGWVRNLDDSRVELVAEGDKEKLNQLLSYLHKGSHFAKVTSVEIVWEDFSGEFKFFEVRY